MYPTFARQEIIAQNLGIRLLCTAPDCFSFSGTSQLWIEEAGVLKNKANVLTDDWKLIFDYTNVQGNISAETKVGCIMQGILENRFIQIVIHFVDKYASVFILENDHPLM